jgi:O-acetyl-ADP-ribose deacetylase (regulator of RNase III)
MPFTIVRQDITKMKVDAIVNAANTDLAMGGGVCGAIFVAAGANELQAACVKLAPIKTGEAVITPGFNLPAKHVIHTAGPVFHGGGHGEEQLLHDAYTNSLKRAVENNCESIAFPLISSGIYGYPKVEALRVATNAIQNFLDNYVNQDAGDLDIFLAVYDRKAFELSEKLLGEVKSYIDEHYVEEHLSYRSDLLSVGKRTIQELLFGVKVGAPKPSVSDTSAGLDDIVGNLDESFADAILRLIDAKGKTDVEVYKRANLDRKLFSKIRTGKGYMPSKRTAVAFAVALELTLAETDDLLERAGFALSHSRKFDVIVEYFIINGKYDIFEINEVLFKYDQPLLGG